VGICGAVGGIQEIELSSNSTFQQQLAIEELRAEDDAHDFKDWPIIQIGLTYRF
jgi:hypothetical protein